MAIQTARAGEDFSGWTELLRLLQDAFADVEGRIDPPSSVLRLTPTSIAKKSQDEALFLATDKGELVGCVFAREQSDSLYVSKLAVRQDRRRSGIARRLMGAVEECARDLGRPILELNTRIELAENQLAFAAMGYIKTAEHAHEGYARPTFVTMRKQLTDLG